MATWLKALDALGEDPGSVPSTHMDSSSRESNPPFGPFQALHTCSAHMYLQAKHLNTHNMND